MLLLDPLSVILPQMDFIKDMIFVMRMITLLGGSVVFLYPQLFSSKVKSNQKIFVSFMNDFLFQLGCLFASVVHLHSSIPRHPKYFSVQSS